MLKIQEISTAICTKVSESVVFKEVSDNSLRLFSNFKVDFAKPLLMYGHQWLITTRGCAGVITYHYSKLDACVVDVC